MFKNLQIGTKLGLAFLLLTLLSVGLGAVAMFQTRASQDEWRGFER